MRDETDQLNNWLKLASIYTSNKRGDKRDLALGYVYAHDQLLLERKRLNNVEKEMTTMKSDLKVRVEELVQLQDAYKKLKSKLRSGDDKENRGASRTRVQAASDKKGSNGIESVRGQ